MYTDKMVKEATSILQIAKPCTLTRCANAALSAGSGAAAFLKKGFDEIRGYSSENTSTQDIRNEQRQLFISNGE